MADQNIDLGSISWDLSAIDKQLIDNRKALDGNANAVKKNKEELQKQRKEIEEATKTIELCNEMQEELNKSLQEGTISQEDYVEAVAAVNDEIQQARERTSELVTAQSELIQSNIEIEANTRDLQREQRTLNTLRAAGREEVYDEIGAYQSLNDELNALKRESKDIGAELVNMKRNGQENTEAYRALEERYRSVTEQAEQLNNEFVNLDQAVGDNQRNVGNYTESIKNAFAGISDGFNKMLSGDFQGGMDEIKTGLKGVKDGASDLFATLAANPWLAVLTVAIGGIIAFSKEMIEHNAYITEANRKVEDLAHTSGELTNELRRAGEAISETFENVAFEDAVREMDALMDDFKISSQEAWDTYVMGLAAGGAANDEFGESIKEYGALFAQNGYSAQQFINILNTGINMGIYSDKLPDAIKEAGLALNEQTKSTRDALINAFGASFSDTLLKNVQQGRLTVAKALDEIADKSEEVNLNQQQQAQLTADLFKGAGEDAGGSMVIFEALNKAQNVTYENLTALQRQTILLANLNKEVQASKDEAFSNTSVQAFRKELDLTWKAIQIGWYRGLAGASEFFIGTRSGLELMGRNLIGFIKAIPLGFREVAKYVGNDLNRLGQLGATAGDILKKAFSLDVEGAKASYLQLKNQLQNFNSDTLSSLSKVDDYLSKMTSKNVNLIKDQNAAKAQQQKIVDAAAAAVAAEEAAKAKAANNKTTGATGDAGAKAKLEAQKKADAEAKKAETKRLADAKKAVADADKLREDLAKKEVENQKERAQQSIDIAKNELAEYIRLNADKYKDDKKLTDAKLKDQLSYFDEVSKKQKALNDKEKESATKSLEIQKKAMEDKGLTNATEIEEHRLLKERISIINDDFASREKDLEKQITDKKKEIKDKYLEDVAEQEKLHRAIAFQQKILDLEIQGGQEKDIALAQEDQKFQELLEKFAEQNKIKLDLDEDKYISDQEIQMARDLLQDEYNLAKDEKEKLRIQNQLDAIAFMESQNAEATKKIAEMAEKAKLAAIADTFGQAKGLFKENTLAYKAMAVAEATISTYLSVTKTLAEYPGPIGWAMSAVQIALGLANVAKIVGVKGFSTGGYTGDGGVNEVAGLVHKGEVVFSQADVQALGGASVVNAMRPTAGGYFGGSVGVSDMPNVQSAMMGGSVVVMLDENSISLLADATYAGTQKGIGDMADNTDIRLGANFG